MRLKSVLGAIALAVTVLVAPYAVWNAHASDNAGYEPEIIGGETVASAPWATGLYYNGSFFCSGAIIASRWVLTARHCIEEGGPTDVRIGDVRINHGTSVNVTRIVKTPNADLALLQLGRSVTTSYAPLASADPPAGATNQIYGWGTIEVGENAPLSDVLKRGSQRVVGSGQDHFGGRSVRSKKINGTAGYGDSGGPMWYGGKVVGVCSTGDYVYTDYGSVAANRDWIRRTSGV
jgi:secreted trypsin-like serine protease